MYFIFKPERYEFEPFFNLGLFMFGMQQYIVVSMVDLYFYNKFSILYTFVSSAQLEKEI